jgi:NCAIR mutase (PurE)-related protein
MEPTMDKRKLEDLLGAVARGEVTPEAASEQLKHMPYQDLGFATLDSHRGLRQGLPEVVFCPGKTSAQVTEIMRRLYSNHEVVLATRATPEMAKEVQTELAGVQYDELSRMLVLGDMPEVDKKLPAVNIVSAGTADLPVAEEAAMLLQAAGVAVVRTYDVGVAGIHRLFDRLPELQKNAVSIVVAGMDGVLPSVVAGLLSGPVIAVPTSVGYGASFQGIAALLTMLNSCAAGLTVVNIDNGFGAGVAAFRVLQLIKAQEPSSRTL